MLQIKWKTKYKTLSEQFHNLIYQIVERVKIDTPSTHLYITAHFHGMAQAL
jgi:hypothetical protein